MDKQEAKKILKEFHDKSALFSVRTALETVLPELKEDEDELEWLKQFIQEEAYSLSMDIRDDEDSFRLKKLQKSLEWLEKQEGCKHIKKDWLEHIKYSGGTSKEWTISDAATLKELIDFLENRTAKLQHDLTRYANWLKTRFTPIEKKSEQKSTWSEEDEEMFKSIMATCELAEQERDSIPARHLLEMQINWLKSLKNRIKNGGY